MSHFLNKLLLRIFQSWDFSIVVLKQKKYIHRQPPLGIVLRDFFYRNFDYCRNSSKDQIFVLEFLKKFFYKFHKISLETSLLISPRNIALMVPSEVPFGIPSKTSHRILQKKKTQHVSRNFSKNCSTDFCSYQFRHS